MTRDIRNGVTEAIVGVQYAHDAPAPAVSDRKRNPQAWRANSRRSLGDVSASYDSAVTTRENYRHWAPVDYLSADASMRPEIRRTTRARARYEVLQNNPLGQGIVLTLANDTIGTGPRLHMGMNSEKYNVRIQRAWHEWTEAIGLTDKLHTMKIARTVDGESLGRISVNPYLESPITLDFKLIECDRLEASFDKDGLRRDYIDGIHLDAYDNVTAYDILRDHPGSQQYARQLEYQTFDHRNIIHWFRVDRAEQHRGISECQAALRLFSDLRRFTLATVASAETAANMSVVVHTDAPSSDFAEENQEMMQDFLFSSIEIDRNAATVLPNEWKIQQMMAAHPATTYAMFKQELISEISRCLCMPYNVAAANSSDHNYASGRLDHQTYHHSIQVDRQRISKQILDRLFNEWMHEAALTGGVLPGPVSDLVLKIADKYGTFAISRNRKLAHSWHFDGFAHSDPVKEAKAHGEMLKNGVMTRRRVYAAAGLDIDEEDAIGAKDAGMTLEEFRRTITISTFFNGNNFGEESIGDGDTEEAKGSGADAGSSSSSPTSVTPKGASPSAAKPIRPTKVPRNPGGQFSGSQQQKETVSWR